MRPWMRPYSLLPDEAIRLYPFVHRLSVVHKLSVYRSLFVSVGLGLPLPGTFSHATFSQAKGIIALIYDSPIL